ELLASYPPVPQVVQDGASGGNHVRAVFGQRLDVLRDGRVEDEPVPCLPPRMAHADFCPDAPSAARRSAVSSSSSLSHGRSSASPWRVTPAWSASSACASSFSQVAMGTSTAWARRCEPKNTGSVSPSSNRLVILPSAARTSLVVTTVLVITFSIQKLVRVPVQ